MDWRGLRATLRFDGAAWRRFAELGCVYGPEWWKRGSPPVIAAIIFAIARAQRAAVLANQRQVRGPLRGPRGWLRERWHAYRVFAEFARSVTEAMEQWGPRPRPLALHVVGAELFAAALAEHRGLVVVTGHFGSWEVAARHLSGLGRPVNMVVAHEPNPTVRDFMHAVRTRHGFRVIYSARSVFTGLPILQALRRDEIVGMQIEPWGPMPGSHEVEFCGRPTRFQLGPFAVARVAGAPLVPLVARRAGIRRHQIRGVGRVAPNTPAESVAALAATVRAYERLGRAGPAQWLMFPDVGGAPAAGGRHADEMVQQAAGSPRM